MGEVCAISVTFEIIICSKDIGLFGHGVAHWSNFNGLTQGHATIFYFRLRFTYGLKLVTRASLKMIT